MTDEEQTKWIYNVKQYKGKPKSIKNNDIVIIAMSLLALVIFGTITILVVI